MKSLLRPLLLLLILVVLVTGGCFLYQSNQPETTRDLLLYGNVDIRQIKPAFQVSGRLETLLVQEGDTVTKGTLLAQIDSVRYRAALQKAQAEEIAQQQALNALLAGSRPQEIEKAKADVKAMAAKLSDALTTKKRLQKLYARKATSRQKLDDAMTTYQAYQASLESAQQALNLIIAGPRQEEIAGAKAKLLAAQAVVNQASKALDDTKLYAPADAVVRNRILEPGDMAFPTTPILTLAKTQPLWVRVYVAEPDLGKLKPGMQAEVHTDSFPDKTYKGWLGYISPTAEFTPKNVETEALRTRLVYQARVFVCNPDNELRLGMPATVRIDLSQQKSEGSAHTRPACSDG